MAHELRARYRLLLVALTATLVLLVAPAAYAAVPMCGENAQSIAAPPIVLPGKGHVLDRVPCPETDEFELGTAPQEGPRPTAPLADDGSPRARPSAFSIPPCPRGPRLHLTLETMSASPGYGSSLERPPRGD